MTNTLCIFFSEQSHIKWCKLCNINFLRKCPWSRQRFIPTISEYQQQRKIKDIYSDFEEKSICGPLSTKDYVINRDKCRSMQLSSLLFNKILDVIVRVIRQGKEIKALKLKRGSKLSVCPIIWFYI